MEDFNDIVDDIFDPDLSIDQDLGSDDDDFAEEAGRETKSGQAASRKVKPLTIDEEYALIETAQNESKSDEERRNARNILIKAHDGSCKQCANDRIKNFGRPLPQCMFDELVQEARMGLDESISKFNLNNENKVRLNSYAREAYMKRRVDYYLQYNLSAVSMPHGHSKTLSMQLVDLYRDFERAHRSTPATQQEIRELSVKFGQMVLDQTAKKERISESLHSKLLPDNSLPVWIIETMALERSQSAIPLNAQFTNDPPMTFLDILRQDPDARSNLADPAVSHERESDREYVEYLLQNSGLTTREKQVVSDQIYSDLPLRVTAEDMDRSPQDIHRQYKSALGKMRKQIEKDERIAIANGNILKDYSQSGNDPKLNALPQIGARKWDPKI